MNLKKYLFSIIAVLTFVAAFGQFDRHEITHDGRTRTYFAHIPAKYNPSKPVSIVVFLHGLGAFNIEDMKNFYEPNQFLPVSDTANFILLAPVAEDSGFFGLRAWNSGAGVGWIGFYLNANIDDIGFLDKMLDNTMSNYVVDKNNIYVCGFSMGGFMTQRLAIQHHDRFAAFASVSGTIGSNITEKTVGKAIRLAHFHGTADQTVGYVNNNFGQGVDPMIDFWIVNNECNKTPNHTTYTDKDPASGKDILVDHYIYNQCNADLEFFKQNNLDHYWMPQNSRLIWEFFRRSRSTVSNQEIVSDHLQVKIYPNPTSDFVTISISDFTDPVMISITDLQGKVLYQKRVVENLTHFTKGELPKNPGMYLLNLSNSKMTQTTKLVIE